MDPSLPHPQLIGGATRTRGQRRGDPGTRRIMGQVSTFLRKAEPRVGKEVTRRTEAAVHRFVKLYGATVERILSLGEHIQVSASSSAEVRQLRGEKAREQKRLKKLEKWYKKHMEPRMRKGGQRFQEVLNSAVASSKSFLDAAISILPTATFNHFWERLKSWWHSSHSASDQPQPRVIEPWNTRLRPRRHRHRE